MARYVQQWKCKWWCPFRHDMSLIYIRKDHIRKRSCAACSFLSYCCAAEHLVKGYAQQWSLGWRQWRWLYKKLRLSYHKLLNGGPSYPIPATALVAQAGLGLQASRLGSPHRTSCASDAFFLRYIGVDSRPVRSRTSGLSSVARRLRQCPGTYICNRDT